MASDVLKTDFSTWVIDYKSVLGWGKYGMVHKAKDASGNLVAAKRIKKEDGKISSKMASLKDLEKLMDLNHPNIVKIFDIYEEAEYLWIIMEYCVYGNLHKYMKNTTLTHNEKLQVMAQLAGGVQYLHENNIIHRDIKPLNILVDSVNPIHVKLTDFDLSKFLDENYTTSNMESRVGTKQFQAPECFLKTTEGKLSYHRSVDLYALGLVFLAMIQHKGTGKSLTPVIETGRDELFDDSVGEVIAQRIKYSSKHQGEGTPELNVVCLAKVSSDAAENTDSPENVWTHIKVIVENMTEAFPENRFSAPEVVKTLTTIQLKDTDCDCALLPVVDAKKREYDEDETCTSSKKTKICQVELDRQVQWTFAMNYAYSIVPVGKHRLLISGAKREEGTPNIIECRRIVNLSDGTFEDIAASRADYCGSASSLCPHPVKEAVLEVCAEYKELVSINMDTDSRSIVYKKKRIDALCKGPANSVIGIEEGKYMYQLQWQSEKNQLMVVRIVDVQVTGVSGLCYIEDLDSVIIVSQDQCLVQAVKLDSGNNGNTLWSYNPGKLYSYNREVILNGLCHDLRGRLYIGQVAQQKCGQVTCNEVPVTKHIVVLNAKSGELINVVDLDEDTPSIIDMCYVDGDGKPELAVLQAGCHVSRYRLQEL